MAEEKKPPITTATATNVGDWISAYYGDDAIDYGKKDKVRHIVRTCQFASVCFVVSKNTKQAHTDFFESNYTAIDTMYVKAAELIIRLLNIKYGAGRPLTMRDFLDCGGGELFKNSSASIDKICADYIGPGGMVEQCENCFPEPKGEDLRKEKESFEDFYEWYEPATEDEKKARALEKKKLLYKNFVDDLDNVKSDHSQLLAVASQDERNSGVLNGQSLHTIYRTATDKSAKMQRELKGQKSAIDFTIKEDEEKAVGIRYNVAKKTAKVAALGGVAAASLGAVIGGVFWPAFLIIPTYSLAKQWLPDWAKSLGEMWGHFEKSIAHKYERQKVDSYYNYLVSFMETGGKPKIRLKDRFFLTPNIIKCLKKGAKSGSVGSSYEGSDGRTHKSEIDRAEGQTSMVMGNLLNAKDADGLVPADMQGILFGEVKTLSKDSSTISNFVELANKYKSWESGLPSDSKYGFQVQYSDKLKECAEKLLFETPLDDLNNYKDKMPKIFATDSIIMEPTKVVAPEVVDVIQRHLLFATKELTGLEGSWKNKSLKDYIYRDLEGVLTSDVLTSNYSDSVTGAERALDMADSNLLSVLSCIENLEVEYPGGKGVISVDTSVDPSRTATMEYIQLKIDSIVDDRDKARVNQLLQEQMGIIFRNADRKDSRKSYESIIEGTFTGKNNFDDIFKKIGEMTFENVGSEVYSKLSAELLTKTKVTPPEMGRYLRSKLGKAAHDIFYDYAIAPDNISKFKTDLPFLIAYLSKLNQSPLLNQQQKSALTAMATVNVKAAFDQFVRGMSNDFTGKYNFDVITQYLEEPYSNTGLKTLFVTDTSPATRDIEKKLASLSGFNDIYRNLKFNGKDMNIDDKGIISKILLRNEADGFTSVRVRDTSDGLVQFLSNGLKVSTEYKKEDFNGKTPDNIQGVIVDPTKGTPYCKLMDKLRMIETLPTDCDKYAAIVALKNKAIYEFRQCLITIANKFGPNSGSGGINNWLTQPDGIAMFDAAIAAWSNGGDSLFEQIDRKMEEIITRLPPAYRITKSQYLSEGEMKRYKEAYSLGLVQEETLGR